MGGSIETMLQPPAPPQYQQQTFGNDQILQYAKSGYGKDMADAYKAEVLNQLRNGSFKDANGVYQAMMNRNENQKQMAAYNQQMDEYNRQLAEQQAAQSQSDSGGWYSG